MRARVVRIAAIAALLLGGAAIAWWRGAPDTPTLVVGQSGLGGAEYPKPRPAPDFTLMSTSGQPMSFAAETRGRLALLFFGYTSCPDVCPTHFAALARVLRDWPAAERERVRVFFVTVDPERDSLAAIRGWLNNFDSTFVGLRGSPTEIADVLTRYRLPPPTFTTDSSSGFVDVGHSAHVLVVTPDGQLRMLYPFGTSDATWEHDLPLLAHASWVEPVPPPAQRTP